MPDVRVGLYPGTFDPITNGHTDIIVRAAKVVDRLIVGVAGNESKGPLFSADERVEMVAEEIAGLDTGDTLIDVRPFDKLLMHYAEEIGAGIIIRGLRVLTDFDYEFQMAGMNARLSNKVETLFMMASEGVHFISSRYVKEIGALGGDISSYVSPQVATRLHRKFGKHAS